jgi:hypothetical protein
MSLAQVRTILDFLVRLAFFAATPFLLVVVASLFPVTGAIVQIGIALAAFFTGEALRRLMTRSKIIRLALSSQLQFETYYRTHKPRPFLYYVFYPLLFPYWTAVREAREEFLLYKGYTLATFALLVASQVVGYWRYFPPELGAREFLPLAAGSFLVETAVVLMFLMPIVTSVVHFHTLRAPRRLVALLVVGLVSVSLAIVRIERRRDPVVSYATRQRVDMRTHAKPRDAEKALIAALREGWKVLPKDKVDVDHDGKVEGDVLSAAQEALVGFYKNDEAHAFDLWYTRRGKKALLVLYFEARGKNEPIWEAMDAYGNAVHDAKQLPPGAFNAMWRMTQ